MAARDWQGGEGRKCALRTDGRDYLTAWATRLDLTHEISLNKPVGGRPPPTRTKHGARDEPQQSLVINFVSLIGERCSISTEKMKKN